MGIDHDIENKPDVQPKRDRDEWPLPTDYPNIIPFSEILSSDQTVVKEWRAILELRT